MSDYLKPQSPLYHKEEDSYFYPLTTVDQVIMEDGSRLNNKISDITTQIVDINTNMAKTAVYTGIFSADGWNGTSAPYTQTLTISGIQVSDNPFVDINLENVSDAVDIIAEWTLIGRVTVISNNTVVGYCYKEKPTTNIPVIFKVVR